MNWKSLTIVVIIGWFLGAASGMMMARYEHLPGPHSRHSQRERFYEKLKLTPDQKTQVDTILQAGRQKLDRLHEDGQRKIEEVRSATRTQIRQLLTADQQTAFDQLNAEKDARLKKWQDRRPDHEHP